VRFEPTIDHITAEALDAMGAYVRRLRIGMALSQAQLAARGGCSQSTISRLERGLVPDMRLRTLAAILRALHASPFDRLRLFAAEIDSAPLPGRPAVWEA
jgi:transcriptional regulator with XRE-family HTH domain